MRADAAQPVDEIDVRHLTTTQCRTVLRARGLEAEAALDLRSLDRTALVGVLRSHGIHHVPGSTVGSTVMSRSTVGSSPGSTVGSTALSGEGVRSVGRAQLPRERTARRCAVAAPTSRSLLLALFCLLAVLTIGVPFLLTELFLASDPATVVTAASGKRRRNNDTSARQLSESVAPTNQTARALTNDTVRTLLSHGPAHAAIDLVRHTTRSRTNPQPRHSRRTGHTPLGHAPPAWSHASCLVTR